MSNTSINLFGFWLAAGLLAWPALWAQTPQKYKHPSSYNPQPLHKSHRDSVSTYCKTKLWKSISAVPFQHAFVPWTLSGDTLGPIMGRGLQNPQKKKHNFNLPFACQYRMYFCAFLVIYFNMLSKHTFCRGPQKPQKTNNLNLPFWCRYRMYFCTFLMIYFNMLSKHTFCSLFVSNYPLGIHFTCFRLLF